VAGIRIGQAGSGSGVVARIEVEGAPDADEVAAADVGVDLGGLRAGVAEELLDVAEVGAGLEEVGGEAVAEGVGTGVGGDAGFAAGGGDDVLGGADGERA
jgi:hypothetical protein